MVFSKLPNEPEHKLPKDNPCRWRRPHLPWGAAGWEQISKTCSSGGRWSCPGSWEKDAGPEWPYRALVQPLMSVPDRCCQLAVLLAPWPKWHHTHWGQAPVLVRRLCWSRSWAGGTERHRCFGVGSEEQEHQSDESAEGPWHRLFLGHQDCGQIGVWHQSPGQGEVFPVPEALLQSASSLLSLKGAWGNRHLGPSIWCCYQSPLKLSATL